MIKNPAAARRYARGLHRAARSVQAEDEVAKGLAVLARAFASPQAAEALRFRSAKAEGALAKAVVALGVSAPAAKLLDGTARLLLKRHRIPLAGEISEAYGEILDEVRGIRRVRVRSAVPLDPAARAKVETVLLLGGAPGTFRVAYEEDPALVGGAVAQIGDVLLDVSVTGFLERFARRISA